MSALLNSTAQLPDSVDATSVIGALIYTIHAVGRDRGWWFAKSLESHGPEKVALGHSEFSEMLAAMRVGRWVATPRPATKDETDKLGISEVVEEGVLQEAADVQIRLFDFLGAGVIEEKWTAAQFVDALLAKIEKNSRHDGSDHGKRF